MLEKTFERSNQSMQKEINPEYSVEVLLLKLKLQYIGQLMQRANSLEKTQMLGKTEGRRKRGRQKIRWLDGITYSNGHEFEQTQGVSEGQGSLVCCSPWGHREFDVTQRLNSSNNILRAWGSLKVLVPKENNCVGRIYLSQDSKLVEISSKIHNKIKT